VTGLAVVEFLIAGAVALVSLAALTGMYRSEQTPR
jgi:Tfp pilus assembly protein PilW